VALLLFGLASLVGIWVTGLFIDRALRRIALLGTGLMVVVGIALTFTGGSALIAGAAILVWGIAFGGAATQVQTAVSAAAGDNADLGIAALTASFNLAIFAAAAVGALIIEGAGAIYLPISMAVVGAAAVGTVFFGHRFAFPRMRRP
jgi:predicted MFS family arabinose efflux permease